MFGDENANSIADDVYGSLKGEWAPSHNIEQVLSDPHTNTVKVYYRDRWYVITVEEDEPSL